ncbi:MAG: hypothetical protein ACRDPY_06675 [Streptosporangiaceae bacterium]
MRHLVGVVLAIVMAAAVFFAASWGFLRLGLGSARPGVLPSGSLFSDRNLLEGFGAVLGTGLLAGIMMAVPWISPLASGLPGLALLGWTGFYLGNVRRAVQYIPLKTHSYGMGFEAMLFDGVLALAGLAMVIPLFIPSRWKRRNVAAAPAQTQAPYAPEQYLDPSVTSPDLAGTQTIAGDGGLLSDWTQTQPQTQTRPQPQIDPNAPTRSQAPWGPADYS